MKKTLAKLFGGRIAAVIVQARAFTARRQGLLLNLGIAFVGLCALGLLRQALTVDSAGEAQTAPLLSAYHSNGLIALLFFGAIASGYAYWCLQFLSGAGPQRLRRQHARLSNLTFVASVGLVGIALLLWNAGVLFAAHSQ